MPVTSTPDPAAADERQEAILAAVGFAAEHSMSSQDYELILPDILARLGEAVDASRAYVFRNGRRGNDLTMDEIAEWCAPGITPAIDLPNNHGFPYFPTHEHYVDRLGSGQKMILKASSAIGVDKQDLDDEDILSSLFVPVFLRDQWWGYLGFDDCRRERDWLTVEVDALIAAAAMIGVTITRRESADAPTETAPAYHALAERLPAITYIDVVNEPDEYPYPTLYMSPKIEEVLGYPAERFVDEPDFWDKVIHPDDVERIVDEDLAKLSEERFEAEYRMIAADGRTVWVHEEAERVAYAPDKRELWHGVMYDITALKEDIEREREAADHLRALDALKDTFLDAVSHELRTPVAAIMGLSLTLERDEGSLTDAERKEFAGRISRNAHKLQVLIQDLLDLNRMNRDALNLERVRNDVSEIAIQALEEADLPETHLVSLDAEPVVVPVDAAKVERIVENLLLNAVRHTPDGTPIVLSVRPEADGVLICVDDEGPGVPEAMRRSIFEPFRQANESPAEGVGIGLSLVSRFAELHGGRAWVEGRLGGGASFRVFLPGPEEADSADAE